MLDRLNSSVGVGESRDNQPIRVPSPLGTELGSRALHGHSLKPSFMLSPGAEFPGLLIQPSWRVSGREDDEQVAMGREMKS